MFVYLRFSAGQTDIPMSGKSFVFESYHDFFLHILVVELSRFLILQFELDALDVNAVGFIDETSNIIYSGSDNGIIKVRKKNHFVHDLYSTTSSETWYRTLIRPQNGSEYPEHIHYFWKNSFEKS